MYAGISFGAQNLFTFQQLGQVISRNFTATWLILIEKQPAWKMKVFQWEIRRLKFSLTRIDFFWDSLLFF